MGFGSFSAGGGTVAEPMILWQSDSSAAQADIGRMKGRMQGFATTVRGAGIQMQMFGQSILGMVGGVLGAFMTFEDAFIGVTRTVDATEAEFAELEKGLRSMALVIPQTAADLADIMKIAGQMGIRGVENLLIFTETVARMGDVTDLSTEEAAFGFARISVLMKVAITDVDRLGSVIVELGNNFATTEPLIVNASVRAAGAANTLGLSTAEMLGIVAQATVIMPRARAAGSTLTMVWTEMADAAFTGGESLAQFARLMNLTTEETAELIKTNPAEAFQLFIKGAGEAFDAGENWVAILDDINLNQRQARELILGLAANFPELARAIKSASGEWDENGALIEESERRYASLSSQIQIFKNLIGEINIILGAALAPTVTTVMDKLRPFIDAFREFADNNPKLMAALGGLVALLGALAFAAGTVLIIAAIVPVLSLLFTTTSLVVFGITALIGAATALTLFWNDLTEEWRVFIAIAGSVSVVLLSIKGILIVLPKLITAIRTAWTILMVVFAISTLWLVVLVAIVAGIAAFVAFSPELRQMAEEFGGLISALLKGEITFKEFWEKTKVILEKLPGAMKTAGIAFRNRLKELGVTIRNWLKEFGIDIRNWLKEFGISLRNRLKQLGIDIRNKLKEFGIFLREWLIQMGKDLVGKIKEWAVKIRNQLKEFGMGIKNTLRETFDGLITPVIEAWKEIWATIQFWWPKYVAVVEFYIKIWTAIIRLYIGIWREIIQFVWPIIWGILTRAYNVIKNIFITAWDALTMIIGIAWDIIVPLIIFYLELIMITVRFYWETLKNIFTLAWGIISASIKIVWVVIKNYVLIGIQLVSGIIRVAMALLRGDWGAAWDAIKDTVSRVWALILDTVVTVGAEIWGAIKLVWEFIQTETETIWTAVSEAILGALRAIRDTGKAIFNGFITMIETGINNVLGGIALWMKALKKLADAFPGANPLGDKMQVGIDALEKGIVIPEILGEGGLAMGPTLAMVGDKGPELIIPLDQLQGLGQGQNFYAPVYQTIKAEDADHAFDIMKRIKT